MSMTLELARLIRQKRREFHLNRPLVTRKRDEITEAERAMIDEFLKTNPITKCPPGKGLKK